MTREDQDQELRSADGRGRGKITPGTDGTTEHRNDGTAGTEETQTAADTSGTAAEKPEQQTRGPPIGKRVANPALTGTHSEITAARDATDGVRSGFFKRMNSLSRRWEPWVSEVSAAVPEVSAAVCVSSVPVVPSFRLSVLVPPFRLGGGSRR